MWQALLIALILTAPMAMAQVPAAEPVVTSQIPGGVTLEKATNPVIKISTEKGDMLLELFPDAAPKHVEGMLTLTKKGYYNNLTFHRVVSGFVIQGGCPLGTGTGGPGYTLPAEFNARKHLKGTLAMARSSDPNSAGSQFYICLDTIPHLDNQYTVFGQLVSGHDVPEKIKQGDKMQVSVIQDQQ
ncbi:MAG TPA: peptidylprolyl isomerase [Candidatus Riflebacteria bacterium]|jgi:cyclophilin family peptidyl-prolyl cis-trans isomerase|nr:peptidylprolyl isomerase [Candidatus Riflebacteria bacterium]